MYKFIFTHKDVLNHSFNDAIIIDNRQSDLDHRLWSEIAGYKILFDKINTETDEIGFLKYSDNDWISLNHYRREISPDYYEKITLPELFSFVDANLLEQYDICHNIEDLNVCIEVMTELYPYLEFNKVLKNNLMVPYNIGIMTVQIFKEYFTFLYTVLSKVLEKLNVKTYEDMYNRVKNNPKYENKNTIEYQCRVISFLAERISTCFWQYATNKLEIYYAPIKLLDENQII